MSDAPPVGAGWAPVGDGRRLFLERHGRGAPTVVFEAGMGMSRSMWGAVVAAVAASTQTVAYDRAGLGRSPAATGRRRLDDLADDLEAVLDHLGPGPFVLVAHSWGGPVVRVVADRRPELVTGLVLVDPTDEGCELFLTPANERRSGRGLRMLAVAGRLHLLRPVARRWSSHLPPTAAAAMRAEDATPAAVATQVAEAEHSLDDLRALRDAPLRTPDVPLVVISGTRIARSERRTRPALVEAHRARAAAHPQGRHVEAAASGHMVPLTEPALVAGEILRVAGLAGGRV